MTFLFLLTNYCTIWMFINDYMIFWCAQVYDTHVITTRKPQYEQSLQSNCTIKKFPNPHKNKPNFKSVIKVEFIECTDINCYQKKTNWKWNMKYFQGIKEKLIISRDWKSITQYNIQDRYNKSSILLKSFCNSHKCIWNGTLAYIIRDISI